MSTSQTRITIAICVVVVVVLQLCCTRTHAASNETTLNVAIIGGGVAGAYAAYALWQANQVVPEYDINITLIEASKRLGGRARHAIIDGRTVELGASMIYGGNYYLANDLVKFGLREKEDVGGAFALHDGQTVVFRSSQYGIITFLQMLLRYQLSLLRYVLLPLRAFWSFTRVYTLQDGGTSFNTTTELLQAQGLMAETQTTFARYAGASPLTSEFLGAINRCNYNQRNEQLHALVGLVSTLPAFDFVQGSISIEGGNAQIARLLATHARAHVVLDHRVKTIKRDGGHANKWLVDGRAFDAVIVATPLIESSSDDASAAIEFDPPVARDAYFKPSDYVSTVTNIVRGTPRIDVDALLATNGAPTNWSCVGALGKGLYKVFTRDEPLDDAALAQLFKDGAKVEAVEPWAAAYPMYRGTGVAGPFVLGDGLFYTSSIERVASAMEMSAIAGKNAALLTARYFEDTLMARRRGKGRRRGVDVL